MSRPLALAAALFAPVLFALLWALTGGLGPLAGAGLGLLAYWAALLAALWPSTGRDALPDALPEALAARPPGRLVTAALALPVVVVGALAMAALGDAPLPPHVILAAAMAAVVTAGLEELFWRGALVPRPSPRAFAAALGLYWAFHAAWAGAQGLGTGLSAPLAALGPLAMGGAWTAARLTSGTLGAGIIGHAALKLFLFVEVAARTVGDA